MEENKQDKDLKKEELNTEKGRKRTGHTWIGDKDEIRPGTGLKPVTRSTMTGGVPGATRIVERPRKPYTGFITEEEIRHAEAAAEVDRMARAEEQAARNRAAQTRIYTGIGSGLADDKPQEEKKERAAARPRRTFTISVSDNSKFRRLIALLAVFVLLLAFEISFFVMKSKTASLPDKTEELRLQTEQMKADNAGLKKDIEDAGDINELTGSRDSWQKIKDQLEE